MEREEKMAPRPIYRFQPEMAKSLLFDEDIERVVKFITVYKLYIRIGIGEEIVEEQIQ